MPGICFAAASHDDAHLDDMPKAFHETRAAVFTFCGNRNLIHQPSGALPGIQSARWGGTGGTDKKIGEFGRPAQEWRVRRVDRQRFDTQATCRDLRLP